MPPQGQECVCQEFDQIVVTVKDETTYSDDSLPAPTDAVVFSGRPTVTVTGTNVERDTTKPYWGNTMHQMTNKFVTLAGDVEIAGPGAAGDIPSIGVLLRSCGLAETVTATTDVQYDPASDNLASVSSYFHQDKDLWKVLGMRSNAKLMMSAGQFAKLQMTMMGLFSLPEDNATLPTIAASSDAEPLILDYANTPTASFFGEDVDINNFELDMGNVMSPKDKPGCYSVQINGRNPTGSITICAPRITVQDIRSLANTYTTGAINVQHGVNAGEIFKVDVPRVQLDLTGISDTDLGENEKGIVVPFKVLPTTGDDDFKFTYQ